MAKPFRNTLRAHAHAISVLARALNELATEHRVAASALERGDTTVLTADSHFAEWLAGICELSAAAERLLALEAELARKSGVTWEEIGGAIGISRQSACERFGTHERWDKTHRTSQLRRARRATYVRWLKAEKGEEIAEYARKAFGLGGKVSSSTSTGKLAASDPRSRQSRVQLRDREPHDRN
ncbi:hypothetical protein [Catellatospora vulcania]|uniref:hypothetical protein n=1 Tax=Catellatospora vulcania TaxID=1460450 RepID=UPI0012D48880|nr:hypothetical protein [Catellatospora vulcania]